MPEKQAARIWRMIALDSNHDPIYGPWETRAEAEQRKADTVDGRFILSAKVTLK